jgi:4-amino-4-deoxy-L-arabinose transferase-like glycosyltransferase
MSREATDREYRMAWALFAAATLASLAALPLHYVGEEGILAVTSLEMWHRGDWLRLWIFGTNAQHGVFANWLVIPLASAIGWEHVLQAIRAIMIVSTAATGAMLYFFAHRLYRDRALAAFAAAIYVTFGDLLVFRGWLGYRDPLLGALVFSAVATLWLGVREERRVWLVASCAFATAAFLTKGLIGYVFVATAGFALLLQARERAFLLRPMPLLLAALTVAFVLFWFRWVQGGSGQGARMFAEILSKLSPEGVGAYLFKLVVYPAELVLRLLPASALVLYFLWRNSEARRSLASNPTLRQVLLIVFLGFLPYWLAPQSHIRYLAPILPLVALACAAAIRACGARAAIVSFRWLWAAVAAKLLILAIAFPVYQARYRGDNYAATAQDIVRRAAVHPLYAMDSSASGLAVIAQVDVLRLPREPVTFPPAHWDSGLVIAREADPALGVVAARYRLGGDELYLLCRGAGC